MLTDKKITNSDKASQGVVAAPDTLTGTPQQNKGIFDRLVSFFADKYNALIDAFVATTGASEIGKTGGGTVQDHISSVLNPHSVNKTQVGLGNVDNTSDINKPISTAQQAINNDTYRKSEVYTKSETNTQIDNKVVQIGAGDMAKTVYDPRNKNTDIFNYAYSKVESDFKFAEKLNSNLTVYVATTGSDSLGDGTQEKPYATIQKALDILPKNLGGKIVTINVGEGNFNGYTIDYFYNGFLHVCGVGKEITIITNPVNVFYNNNYNLRISKQKIEPQAGTECIRSITNQKLIISECSISGANNKIGVNIQNQSNVGITASTIKNCTTAIRCLDSGQGESGSNMIRITLSDGSENSVGYYAESGIIFIGYNTTLSATTLYSAAYSGRIYSSTQTNIPNY